jgi:hypothetical protein
MKNTWIALLFALALPAQAVPMVSLDPLAGSTAVGGTVSISLNISGMGNGATPSLGAWLAEISFSGSIVNITAANVVFGSGLDLGIFGSLQFVDDSTGGIIHADELSIEDPADLATMQSGAFTLATFTFTGLSPGVSPLSFSRLELSDENGAPIDVSSAGSSITVRTAGTSVPDGGVTAILSVIVGLLLLGQRVLVKL